MSDQSPDVTAVSDFGNVESEPRYILQLYVAGTTPRSARAIASIRMICETHLKDRYDLEVIDISQGTALAHHEQIIATPTLLKKHPLPPRSLIGDMSRIDRVLTGLDIHEVAETVT